MRTTSIARTTPAQKPLGLSNSKVFPSVFARIPAPDSLIQDASAIQETPPLADGQIVVRLRNKLKRLIVRSDCLGQPPIVELPSGGGASPEILAVREQEVIGEP